MTVREQGQGRRRMLHELLPEAEGSDAIRRCWGEVPPFRHGQILHVKRGDADVAEESLLLTVFLFTHGPEDVNECKPSKLVIEFSGSHTGSMTPALRRRTGFGAPTHSGRRLPAPSPSASRTPSTSSADGSVC